MFLITFSQPTYFFLTHSVHYYSVTVFNHVFYYAFSSLIISTYFFGCDTHPECVVGLALRVCELDNREEAEEPGSSRVIPAGNPER